MSSPPSRISRSSARRSPPRCSCSWAPSKLADTVAAHLPIKLSDKQAVLELSTARDQMEKLLALLEGEIEILEIEKKIRGRVKKQMERTQREFYLNEQM